MGIKMATWVHGNAAVAEFAPLGKRNMAGSARFLGADVTTNFFHFPLTTPVIIDDRRPKLTRICVLHTLEFCEIKEIQVRSGRSRIAVFHPLQEAGSVFQRPMLDHSELIAGRSMFDFGDLLPPVQVDQGLGITLKVAFDSHDMVQLSDGTSTERRRDRGAIEFFSAGADWAMV